MKNELLKVGDVRMFGEHKIVGMVYIIDENQGGYYILAPFGGSSFIGVEKCFVRFNVVHKQVQLKPEMREAFNNIRDLLLRKRSIRQKIMDLGNELVDIENGLSKYGASGIE